MQNIPPKNVLLSIFTKMSLLKQNDERMRAAIRQGKIFAPYYSYRGQEAIPAAVSTVLRPTDYVCTVYRGIHDMLAQGCPVDKLWAEVAGRATGFCKGKGGAMHISNASTGVMVTTGIVGSSLPIANGLAWGSTLKGTDAVTVAYFGDGASNIGHFHESLNMASLWKLPVIFVCCNNQFAEHTRTENCTAIDRIAKRAASYSMPGVTVNGNDPVAMYWSASEAVERARAGQGPTLIEAQTFRFFGHVFGDDDAYMRPDERKAGMEADPYPQYRGWLLEGRYATEAQLAEIEKSHAQTIEDALQFALKSPYPEPAEILRDVYAHELTND
jgi:acetoin:2,6-dichlorophenolindophenol oxidoreductase subunit alpha